jgi:hypothetical protein
VVGLVDSKVAVAALEASANSSVAMLLLYRQTRISRSASVLVVLEAFLALARQAVLLADRLLFLRLLLLVAVAAERLAQMD